MIISDEALSLIDNPPPLIVATQIEVIILMALRKRIRAKEEEMRRSGQGLSQWQLAEILTCLE